MLGCALLVACCLSPFDSFAPVILKLKADTLYSCLLSLVSLCGLSLTHCYRSIYICFIATENSSVFNLCCMELVQHNHIHSIRWPFTHPFTCKHIHIQLTICSYHRHMLSYHYTLNLFHNLSSISDCSPVLQLSNHLCYNYRTASPENWFQTYFLEQNKCHQQAMKMLNCYAVADNHKSWDKNEAWIFTNQNSEPLNGTICIWLAM